METIVSGLINLRHKATDVLVSYQRLRAVEPLIYSNCRYARIHYQADNVYEVKDKITHPAMYKIAQNIINNRYYEGDNHFFVYLYQSKRKIKPDPKNPFKLEEFQQAVKEYLNSNRKEIKEFQEMHDIGKEEAIKRLINIYTKQFY